MEPLPHPATSIPKNVWGSDSEADSRPIRVWRAPARTEAAVAAATHHPRRAHTPRRAHAANGVESRPPKLCQVEKSARWRVCQQRRDTNRSERPRCTQCGTVGGDPGVASGARRARQSIATAAGEVGWACRGPPSTGRKNEQNRSLGEGAAGRCACRVSRWRACRQPDGAARRGGQSGGRLRPANREREARGNGSERAAVAARGSRWRHIVGHGMAQGRAARAERSAPVARALSSCWSSDTRPTSAREAPASPRVQSGIMKRRRG